MWHFSKRNIYYNVGITEGARRVTDDVALIDDKLLSTEDKVNKIKQKIDNNLWPKYRELRDFSVDRIVNEAKNSSKFNMVRIGLLDFNWLKSNEFLYLNGFLSILPPSGYLHEDFTFLNQTFKTENKSCTIYLVIIFVIKQNMSCFLSRKTRQILLFLSVYISQILPPSMNDRRKIYVILCLSFQFK